MTRREARRIASELPMGSAKILAGFVSKPWPHHGGSLDEWQVLQDAGLVNGFTITSRGERVGRAALSIFDSVSLDEERLGKEDAA